MLKGRVLAPRHSSPRRPPQRTTPASRLLSTPRRRLGVMPLAPRRLGLCQETARIAPSWPTFRAQENRAFIQRTFKFSSTCYPETVYRIYIINCPAAFPVAWRIIRRAPSHT